MGYLHFKYERQFIKFDLSVILCCEHNLIFICAHTYMYVKHLTKEEKTKLNLS